MFGTLVSPVSYQAEAFVVVYKMPTGFDSLISPDEANTINAYYQAGALQPSVIARIQLQYPALTASAIRSAVTVSIVAYTPLTRVTATASTPESAVLLANVVSNAWVRQAGLVNSTAYTSTENLLLDHEAQLQDSIATTTAALKSLDPKSAKAIALNDQLQGQETQLSQVDNQLNQLHAYRYDVAGNAYQVTSATIQDVTQIPDIKKSVATGAAVGLALGIVTLLWFARGALRLNLDIAGPALLDNGAPRQRTTGAPPPRATGGPASIPIAHATGSPAPMPHATGSPAPMPRATGRPASVNVPRPTGGPALTPPQPQGPAAPQSDFTSYDN
jgi:hypothetical protein